MLASKLTMSTAGHSTGGASIGWISTFGAAGTDRINQVALDSTGGVYTIGTANGLGTGNSNDDALLTKYTSNGTIEWQRVLGGTNADYGNGIAIDSSNNICITGYTYSVNGTAVAYVAKYNSSGTLQWQRWLGGGSEYGNAISTDSSGNVYVTGRSFYGGTTNYDFLTFKYDSSGTLQWQRRIGGSGSSNEIAAAIVANSSGNTVVVGYSSGLGAGSDDILIVRYGPTSSLLSSSTLGGTGSERGYGVALDSSDNFYIVGSTTSAGAGGTDLILAKYNSSATLQWQRTLGGTGTDLGSGVAVDSSNNVYVVGQTDSQGAGSYDVLIAKYNSAGTLQWQRVLGIAANGEYGYGIAVDSASGHFYITGFTTSVGAGGWDAFVAKFPVSGSGIGTFGIWTYQESTLTAATSNLTANSGLTTSAGASSFSNGTATLTDTPVIQTFPIA